MVAVAQVPQIQHLVVHFSSRGYRTTVGQCGSLVLPSPGGGGVGQKLKVDIVGRWGRVAPMKKKVVRSQERWGLVS